MVQSSIFLCIRPFSAWWHPNKQSNNQPVILGQACSWPVRITWSKLDCSFNLLKLFYILLKLALGSVVPLTMFCSLFLLQYFLFQTFMFVRFFIICLASASVSRASHVLIQVLAINNNIFSALWHFMINLRSKTMQPPQHLKTMLDPKQLPPWKRRHKMPNWKRRHKMPNWKRLCSPG